MAPKKGRLLGQDLALEMASLPPKDYNHKWPKMKVKLLGVWFISIQSDIMMSANYSEKLEKIKSQLSCWKYRWLTNWKITIMLNTLCCMWSTMITYKGGLKMTDITYLNKFLKTSWIKKYLDKTNDGKWKISFDLEIGKINMGFFKLMYNLNVKDRHKGLHQNNMFRYLSFLK